MAEYAAIGFSVSGSDVSAHVKTTFWSLPPVDPVAPVVSWASATCAIAALANAPASISAMASWNLVRRFIAPPRSNPEGPKGSRSRHRRFERRFESRLYSTDASRGGRHPPTSRRRIVPCVDRHQEPGSEVPDDEFVWFDDGDEEPLARPVWWRWVAVVVVIALVVATTF